MNELIEILDKELKELKKNYNFENLEIKFKLSSPLNLTYPFIFFDSLIARQMLFAILKNKFYLLPAKINIFNYLNLDFTDYIPIKKTKDILHASVGFYSGKSHIEYIYKRFEERFAPFKKKISRGSGYFKDFSMQHIYIAAKDLTFYICGDYKTINQLCETIISVGNDTRNGWGLIKDYEINKINEDRSLLYNGIASRPIPKKYLKNFEELVPIAYKFPYWDGNNIELCAVPFTKTEINL